MTHMHDSGFIKITINDDDSNNNDSHNNILTSWNLNTSWLLLFLLVHCWITLTASTTSAFVKLSSPWLEWLGGPSVGSMLLALTLFGVLDKTDFRLGVHAGGLSLTLLHESNRPTIQTSPEAENIPRNGYCSTNSIKSFSRPGGSCLDRYIGRHLDRHSTKYRSSIDCYTVDTRLSIGRYISWVSTDISTDTPIGRYSWRSPILHQYFTDTSPIYRSIYRSRHRSIYRSGQLSIYLSIHQSIVFITIRIWWFHWTFCCCYDP